MTRKNRRGGLGRRVAQLRGGLSLVLMALCFLLADLVQRTVIVAWIGLRPGSRDRVLDAWIRLMARMSLRWLVGGVAGARLPQLPRLPARGRVLILMNHQSLLDIPMAVLALEQSFPWFVTRRRYARGIPVVSHMLRLYGFPLVEPGSGANEQTAMLAEHARSADRPMLIFPEGHRTRDGEIRPFRRGGASAILATGTWEVYALVGDGFWKCARLQKFAAEAGSVEARVACLGPFSHDARHENTAHFLAEIRGKMVATLEQLRADDDHGS